MIFQILDINFFSNIFFFGVLFTVISSFVSIEVFKKFLPHDQGRAYAVNGSISQGKPRGSGLIFITVFAICSLLFIPLSIEFTIYILLVLIEMLSGYFDDRATTPWGEWKKGIIDLVVSIICALTFVFYNGTTINLIYNGSPQITIPVVLFVILAIILIWVSINVTNCSDGVDGLSGTLSIFTLLTFYGITYLNKVSDFTNNYIILFTITIFIYLWYNSSPSKIMMGDAGSRAIGFFIAIIALKSGSPLLYLPAAIILIIDGGLGLIKLFLLRTLKIKFLANTRTPIHDHMRKSKGWSDTQVVFRFAIIQGLISLLLILI